MVVDSLVFNTGLQFYKPVYAIWNTASINENDAFKKNFKRKKYYIETFSKMW